ncbi:sugar ABC transporter permease [Planctomycetota bacterium]|nr:sugar ABC transporter permease [Planctomycetota bacterium]
MSAARSWDERGAWRWLRFVVLAGYAGIALVPLLWLALTSIKAATDTTSTTARFIPAAESAVSGAASHSFVPTAAGWTGLHTPLPGSPATFLDFLLSSLIIGLASTVAAVALGTVTAYGFSRFRIAGGKDWLFFILSTRFMPPLAVVAPVLLMYQQSGLTGTHLGLILLYTVFNLSLAVWLMKGFIDEIPRAFEESALVDGYTRTQAFFRIILPQARTGMAVTAVFCLIAAWNEYGFALVLGGQGAATVPVWFAGLQGNISGVPWPVVAAGAVLFVTPLVVFAVLVRNHLLRGMTFGTVKG